LSCGFEDQWIRSLADLALKLLEEVATEMRLLFGAPLRLHPLFKAGVVYILDTSSALAC